MATKEELLAQADALRAELDKLNAEAGGLNWDDEDQCKYFLGYEASMGRILSDEKYFKHSADMRNIYCVDPDFVAKAIHEIGEANLLIYLGRA